jgi:hypothetical protein
MGGAATMQRHAFWSGCCPDRFWVKCSTKNSASAEETTSRFSGRVTSPSARSSLRSINFVSFCKNSLRRIPVTRWRSAWRSTRRSTVRITACSGCSPGQMREVPYLQGFLRLRGCRGVHWGACELAKSPGPTARGLSHGAATTRRSLRTFSAFHGQCRQINKAPIVQNIADNTARATATHLAYLIFFGSGVGALPASTSSATARK